MRIGLIAPEFNAFVSGGNIYNEYLTSAIEQASCNVIQVQPDKIDQIDSTCSAVIVDSMYLREITQNTTRLPDNAYCLMHMLPSRSESDADLQSFIEHCRGVIATSQHTAESIRYFNTEVPILTLEPAPTLITDRRTPPTAKVNALMVNNVVPGKGIIEFLQALSEARLPPFFRLDIIGDLQRHRDYALQCMDFVRNDSLLPRSVYFLGQQDRKSVSRFFGKSNLFISTSHHESYGMAIQEAALAGLPLLILDRGNAASHVIKRINGWTENTVAAMVDVFARLNEDSSQFIEMQKSALQYKPTAQNSWDALARKLIDFVKNTTT